MTLVQHGATVGVVGVMGPGSRAGVTAEGVMATGTYPQPTPTSSVIPAEVPGSISMTLLQHGATFGIVVVMGPGSAAGVTAESVRTPVSGAPRLRPRSGGVRRRSRRS
jgi:hypothetical protein